MSNLEVIELPPIEIEPYQVTEVLRCLFHTILFNRALGSVVARDVDAELFDITWPHCGDPAAERRLETKIGEVKAFVERNQDRKAVVRLSFFERRAQSGSWFLPEQRLTWEQWVLTLVPIPSPPELGHAVGPLAEATALQADVARARRRALLQSTLEGALQNIVTAVNEKREHIPPVVSGAALTFPFDVSVTTPPKETSSAFGVDLVRRMLSAAQPPSVLH